jgi:hypothetical protein
MPVSQENNPRPRFRSEYDRLLPGVRTLALAPNPAAGADWSLQVPSGRSWRVQSLSALLTTSATVANRLLGLQITWAGTLIWSAINTAAVAASVAHTLIAQRIVNPNFANTTGTRHWVDVPDYWLPPQAVISAWNSNIQAGDQWSAIAAYVEERWEDDSDITLRHQLQEDELAREMGLDTPLTTGGPRG